MSLRVLSPREASIFACVTDTVVAPTPLLPPVSATTAVAAFDSWLWHSPRLNRLGLRALFLAAELVPRLFGLGTRLRALGPDQRAAALERAERSGPAAVRGLVKIVRSLACLCYYGDDGVMRRLGYDARANVRHGRELRAREGRP